MSDDSYNGYPNRETWAAALWQDNDEGICDRVREMAAEARDNNAEHADGGESASFAAAMVKYELAQAIEQMWGEFADPDFYDDYEGWVKGAFPMLSEVGSLWRVDWNFIADSVLSD
jgi:hypothetical protein